VLLAETVAIDGKLLLFVLAVLVIGVASAVAIATLGAFWAYRAGRDQTGGARAGASIAVALELLAGLGGLKLAASAGSNRGPLGFVVIVLAAQGLAFWAGTRKRSSAPGPGLGG